MLGPRDQKSTWRYSHRVVILDQLVRRRLAGWMVGCRDVSSFVRRIPAAPLARPDQLRRSRSARRATFLFALKSCYPCRGKTRALGLYKHIFILRVFLSFFPLFPPPSLSLSRFISYPEFSSVSLSYHFVPPSSIISHILPTLVRRFRYIRSLLCNNKVLLLHCAFLKFLRKQNIRCVSFT